MSSRGVQRRGNVRSSPRPELGPKAHVEAFVATLLGRRSLVAALLGMTGGVNIRRELPLTPSLTARLPLTPSLTARKDLNDLG